MSDESKRPEGLPPGAIHLGTFKAVGAGTYVGGVLKLANDPENDLLATADSFRIAADRCLTSCRVISSVEMLTVPGAVCAALACELYLKFVQLKELGKARKGHDLHALFSGLPDAIRQALVAHRSDVEEVLTRNRLHFEVARYHHEVAQFSFRQQELLQLAESLGSWVHATYRQGSRTPRGGA